MTNENDYVKPEMLENSDILEINLPVELGMI